MHRDGGHVQAISFAVAHGDHEQALPERGFHPGFEPMSQARPNVIGTHRRRVQTAAEHLIMISQGSTPALSNQRSSRSAQTGCGRQFAQSTGKITPTVPDRAVEIAHQPRQRRGTNTHSAPPGANNCAHNRTSATSSSTCSKAHCSTQPVQRLAEPRHGIAQQLVQQPHPMIAREAGFQLLVQVVGRLERDDLVDRQSSRHP